MPLFSTYDTLPTAEQMLHGFHFMLCAFALLIACVPMMTAKGSAEHKFAGLIYLPVSFAALTLATFMAWNENSFVLFCFNGFCAYLLLSGWRAVHQLAKPTLIDWSLPAGLATLALLVALHALVNDEGTRSLYLLGFALNGFYLAWRDWQYLKERAHWHKHSAFFANMTFGAISPAGWINRHVAGMIGSVLANLSVIVLTLLPIELHWLWPASLIAIGLYIAEKERAKKRRIRQAMSPSLQAKFSRDGKPRKKPADDYRRAA